MKAEKAASKAKVFHFKQFDIVNEKSAMKVNTDGVLLGAWTYSENNLTIWDVGTGTGVIALMMAQRFPAAMIHALDIDRLSVEEARLNFANSPWSDRLFIHEGDFSLVGDSLPDPDLIVCNPPYFDELKHNLVSPSQRKASARHEAGLSYKSLLETAANRLNDVGRLCMISPSDREDDIEWEAVRSRMHLVHKSYISSREDKKPSRILWSFAKTACSPIIDEIAIRNLSNDFTPEYSRLVSPFYINID